MCLFNVKDGFLGEACWVTRPQCAGNRNGRGCQPCCDLPPAALCAEAVVRGYKLGLLTTADYNNLCQCETLEDIKLYLVRALAGIAPTASGCRPPGFACSARLFS